MGTEGEGCKSSLGTEGLVPQKTSLGPASVRVPINYRLHGSSTSEKGGFLRDQGCLKEQAGFELNLKDQKILQTGGGDL